ncbi:MAG: ATP-binding protein [Chloroflexi bacterium]|nr:ATP-binding protein [Chloroflexota bacterium]
MCDNGEGVSPEVANKLFVEFTRLDQTRAKGHGLGLSIVKRIVEKLDGRVGDGEIGQMAAAVFILRCRLLGAFVISLAIWFVVTALAGKTAKAAITNLSVA